MFSHRIAGLRFQRGLLLPNIVMAHSKTCPTQKKRVCPGSSKGESGGASGDSLPIKVPDFKRAERSGPVRYGFLPDEWFRFFAPITGVSGPYVFGLVLINYWLSKEIFIMEHEYYLGLSIALMTYYGTTTFGPSIAKDLDSSIDAIVADMKKGRDDEKKHFTTEIENAQAAQTRANGQKLLMDAKKENIAMQLEAAYRERLMIVYRSTKGRLDYQAKLHWTINRIHQKWMIDWILESVRKAITPEFEQQALNAAIKDLAAVAGKA